MATSWSNPPHVHHAGTFALHTQKCLRWLETSVLHSSPLRSYLALWYRDDTHTHTQISILREKVTQRAQSFTTSDATISILSHHRCCCDTKQEITNVDLHGQSSKDHKPCASFQNCRYMLRRPSALPPCSLASLDAVMSKGCAPLHETMHGSAGCLAADSHRTAVTSDLVLW